MEKLMRWRLDMNILRNWLSPKSKIKATFAHLILRSSYAKEKGNRKNAEEDSKKFSKTLNWLLDRPIAFIAVVHTRMKARYYRVTRLVVMPDYQGISVGKRLLNFIAELYTSQTKIPFYILTSNPQIIRGNMENCKIMRFGHASKGKENTRINNEIRGSLSRNRITASMQYVPVSKTKELATFIS